MKITLILFAGIILGIMTAKIICSGKENMAQTAEVNKAVIQTAQDNFYIALNAMFKGKSEPMSEVWSHSDDVIYMGPDKIVLRGWEKVSANWEKQAAVKMGGKVVVEQEHLIFGQDMATIHNYEVGENTDENGQIVKVSIRATNVYRKENDQWKMVAHHTDILPFLVGK